MNIPGHLAIGLAQHQLPPLARRRRTLFPLLIASLFPDLIDKTIGYGLGFSPDDSRLAMSLNLPQTPSDSLCPQRFWPRRLVDAGLVGLGAPGWPGVGSRLSRPSTGRQLRLRALALSDAKLQFQKGPPLF